MLDAAHREILNRLYATNVPPRPGDASIAFSAADTKLLIEALVALDPDEIPMSQTQNVLGWTTSICGYEGSMSRTKDHVLDPLIECLRKREME